MAEAQNFARQLMETPSNHMTPTMFVDTVNSQLGAVKISSGTKLEVVPGFVNLSPSNEKREGLVTMLHLNVHVQASLVD